MRPDSTRFRMLRKAWPPAPTRPGPRCAYLPAGWFPRGRRNLRWRIPTALSTVFSWFPAQVLRLQSRIQLSRLYDQVRVLAAVLRDGHAIGYFDAVDFREGFVYFVDGGRGATHAHRGVLDLGGHAGLFIEEQPHGTSLAVRDFQ